MADGNKISFQSDGSCPQKGDWPFSARLTLDIITSTTGQPCYRYVGYVQRGQLQ